MSVSCVNGTYQYTVCIAVLTFSYLKRVGCAVSIRSRPPSCLLIMATKSLHPQASAAESRTHELRILRKFRRNCCVRALSADGTVPIAAACVWVAASLALPWAAVRVLVRL